MFGELAGGQPGHSCALVSGPEHGVEVLSAFVTAGLRSAERITLGGLTEQQQGGLLTRLREDGADPAGAIRDGQLTILETAETEAMYGMPAEQVAIELSGQAMSALSDRDSGIRFGWFAVGCTLSPLEGTLNQLIRDHPARALCLYAADAPPDVLSQARRLHDRALISTALYDDGDLRVSALSRQAIRLAGRIHAGNRKRVVDVVTDAARHGRRTIDAASLREVDSDSLFALLTTPQGLSLCRPNAVVQTMMCGLETRLPAQSAAHLPVRNGTPVAGRTAAEAATNLIWRTFGSARPAVPESVLDWAGLLGLRAAPGREVAGRRGVAPGTLLNRVRHVRIRGTSTPLTPLLVRDATRRTQPSEDHLSRQRLGHLLGLPEPRPS